jgi:hypothetical protein
MFDTLRIYNDDDDEMGHYCSSFCFLNELFQWNFLEE